jgi:hypothetical protein
VNHVPEIPLPSSQPEIDSPGASDSEASDHVVVRDRIAVQHPFIGPPMPPTAPKELLIGNFAEEVNADLGDDLYDTKQHDVAQTVAGEYLMFLYSRPTRFVTLIREETTFRWGLSVEVKTGRVVGIQPKSIAETHGGIQKFDRLIDIPQSINRLRDPYMLEVRMLVTTDFKRPENMEQAEGRRMFEVDLNRIADEPWGFAWNREIFGTQGKRVVEAVIANTPVWRANDQCTDPSRVVVAGDELVDVNRKQGFEAIGLEISNSKRIKCVFARDIQPLAANMYQCYV